MGEIREKSRIYFTEKFKCKSNPLDANAKPGGGLNMVQLRYWLQNADELGIHEHPIKQMEKLGYKILHGVPQTIGDQWWVTVDRLIEPLPKYLEVMEYDLKDWGFYDEWRGGALTFDGLLSICQSYRFDPEKIGLHFLTVLANWNKVEV